MQGEFSICDVISERTFLFIYPVHSLCLCKTLLAVIADEYLLLKHAAHILYAFLFVDPVVDLAFCLEYLSAGRGYHKIGFDIAHH